MKKRMVLAVSSPSTDSGSSGFWNHTMYMSGPKRLRMIAMGSAGARGRKGVLRPMTPATREGCMSGICHTTMPPQSWPMKIAFSIPR